MELRPAKRMRFVSRRYNLPWFAMIPAPNTSPASTHNSGEHHALFPKEAIAAFLLVTGLFFLWGIPNNLNDVLIRQFMKSFELTRFKAGLVQSAFYLGYFAFSVPAALLMQRVGYKIGLMVGLLIYGLGALLFWPAAQIGQYGFFLFALFVIAAGLSFLETGANPLIAQFGDPASSERRLNFSQAFNPLGSIAGVLVGTAFIFSGIELTPQQVSEMRQAGTYDGYLHQESLRVIVPYLVVGGIAWVWAILLSRTKFPAFAEAKRADQAQEHSSVSGLFRYSHFVQAVLAQFLYIGAQVGTWSFFIQYVQDYTGQSEKVAGYFLTGTLVAFGVGRFFSAYLMNFISPNRLMGIYSLINMCLVAIGVLLPGWIGLWAIFLTSFFMSLMFPTIFALGLKNLGVNTKIGGSLIVMAIVGGAVITPIIGLLAEVTNSMAKAMLIPLVCYAFVSYYGFVGSKTKATAA